MKLREFNEDGLVEAHSLLDRLREGEDATDIATFLTDDVFSHEIGITIANLPRAIDNRFQLALWLNRGLDELLSADPIGSVGMWTWLAIRLLDVIAPTRADGTRKIGERSLYVLESDNWQRYYRHLLAGPCRVMRAHWSNLTVTEAILAGKPNVPGELYEQIASRTEVITSPALVSLTKRLYWDGAGKTLKRGAGGKGAGSSRRLAALLMQLDLTWDLAEMTDDALVALLPSREFSRFVS